MTDAFAIGTSLVIIVVSSVIIGAVLPLFFEIAARPHPRRRVMQVVMDLVGVLITCAVAQAIMPTPKPSPTNTRRVGSVRLDG